LFFVLISVSGFGRGSLCHWLFQTWKKKRIAGFFVHVNKGLNPGEFDWFPRFVEFCLR
jgi:hypothetical protein